MSKNLKIYLVTIELPNGDSRVFHVRAASTTAAAATLFREKITATLATQDDVLHMARAGIVPIGDEPEPDPTVEAQQSLPGVTDFADADKTDVGAFVQQ